jgi:hypothetical protein
LAVGSAHDGWQHPFAVAFQTRWAVALHFKQWATGMHGALVSLFARMKPSLHAQPSNAGVQAICGWWDE